MITKQPQSVPMVTEVKDAALTWLRERFEIPDAEWLPGIPGRPDRCPMAEVLQAHGYQRVSVATGISGFVRYTDADGHHRKVAMPPVVRMFPYLFDVGEIRSLIASTLINPWDKEPVGSQPGPATRAVSRV